MAGQWFSPGTPVSSSNKTDSHDITEILLKVALNTMTYRTFARDKSSMTNTHKATIFFMTFTKRRYNLQRMYHKKYKGRYKSF
jgi:hypothetical protein